MKQIKSIVRFCAFFICTAYITSFLIIGGLCIPVITIRLLSVSNYAESVSMIINKYGLAYCTEFLTWFNLIACAISVFVFKMLDGELWIAGNLVKSHRMWRNLFRRNTLAGTQSTISNSSKPQFICCFCGQTIINTETEPYIMSVSNSQALQGKDEGSQNLHCHVKCLEGKLTAGVPLLK